MENLIILLANKVDPDQMPHFVTSDQVHCWSYGVFSGFQVRMG